MKPSTRLILILSLLVFSLTVFGGLAMFHRYNMFDKAVIENLATETLGVKVTIGELELDRERDTARIGHLQIFNPRGFSDGAAVQIVNIDIITDSSSHRLIKYTEIAASGIQANLEVKKNTTNIESITKKMHSKTAAHKQYDETMKLKVIADRVVFDDVKVRARYVLDNSLRQKIIAVPHFEMAGIGQAENGQMIKAAISQVWEQIAPQINAAAQQAGFLRGMEVASAGGHEDQKDEEIRELEDMGTEHGGASEEHDSGHLIGE
ncbi:MAG: hypothetical protein IT558_02320 [Alphaproteobacteria bacterium]|nr:hypothetical protein [Alphaproteobacteria bacterium]